MDAIYARQSIDKKGSLSIEGQIELCRKFTVDDALVFSDKGFSGKNTKRPAFGELMEAVEAGRVKKIVVYRLDRFSRSSRISARSGSFCVKTMSNFCPSTSSSTLPRRWDEPCSTL